MLKGGSKDVTVCLLSKGREKSRPGCTGHVPPHLFPDCFLWLLLNSHCHFFLKEDLLLLISIFFLTWANSKQDNIWTVRVFLGFVQLLRCGLCIWLGEILSLDLLPTPPHPSQPVHSLLSVEEEWKRASQEQPECSQSSVCPVFLSWSSGHMDLLFQKGDGFAPVATLAGPLCAVSERN